MSSQKILCLEIVDNHEITMEALKLYQSKLDVCYLRQNFVLGLKYLFTGGFDKVIITTYCVSYKIWLLVIIGNLLGKSVTIGVHCGNQFLDLDRLSLSDYCLIKNRIKIISVLRYYIFIFANKLTSKFVRRFCHLFCIGKNLENFLIEHGCLVDSLLPSNQKDKTHVNKFNVLKGKSFLLYGRLDEGRINYTKFDKLLNIIRKNDASLTIIANRTDQLRLTKRLRSDFKNVVFVKGPVGSADFETHVKIADLLASIISDEPVIKQFHREVYNKTVISGIGLDSLVFERPVYEI